MYAEPLIALLAFAASLGFAFGHHALSAKASSSARLQSAVSVVATFADSGPGIPKEQVKQAHCVAVIPGFKRGTLRDVASGRGYMTCRDDNRWSPPVAIILNSSSSGIQPGKEKIDVVMLSVGGNRPAKSTSVDPNSKAWVFSSTRSAPVEIDLDGSTLKSDESGNKALYGKATPHFEKIDGNIAIPTAVQAFANKVASTFN